MRFPFTASVVSMSLLIAGSAAAAPFIPKINQPTSYKDIKFGLDEMRKNIDSVQCGGWDDNSFATVNGTSIVGSVPMPDMSSNLPGRTNVAPLGDPASGLGQRGEFEFPESAVGYSSACNIFMRTIIDDDLRRLQKDLKMYEDGSVGLIDGSGFVDINPYQWCIRTETATPKLCKRLFDAWQQAAAILPREDIEAVCPCPEPNDGCPVRPPKRYCFDSAYTFECRGSADKRTPIETTYPEDQPQDPTCRTPWKPGFENAMTQCHPEQYDVLDADGAVVETRFRIIVDAQGKHRATASSYYRHYAENFTAPAVTVTAPGEDNVWDVRAECYEYYKEQNDDGTDFDPKDDITGATDEQCEFVIASGGEQTPKSPEWQTDDGHDQKASVKGIAQDSPRAERSVPQPWVADSETNLTMIDAKSLRDLQKNFDNPTDITAMFGVLIPIRQTASKSVAKNARTDQFDDTADRDIAAFFEEQQRELLVMTADPTTRLIMPARFLVGLAPNDPIFQYVSHTISRSDGTVEVTLKAGLEDIGNVLTSFQRMFVAPTREVRIPVLVPLASVAEIDARIADWKLWQRATELRSTDLTQSASMQADPTQKAEMLREAALLDAAAASTDLFLEKLRQYRERAESVRLLRGALLTYLTKLYDSQKLIRAYFADWYEQNSGLLLLSSERAVQRRELKRIWRLLQRSMLQADACQMLWCSNQRYSAPVYSLLDNWWGIRDQGEKRDPDFRPPSLRDLGYQQPQDQVYDFSNVKFPNSPWLIPTLWPVQVRVRIPSPPSFVGAVPPSIDSFPDLPPLPDATVFASFPVPSVELPDTPLLTPPITQDLEPAKDMLRQLRTIIDGTDVPQQLQEENALARGEPANDTDDFPLDRDSLRGAYCRFPPSLITPPDPNQDRGKPEKIIHIENELRERLARLFSRWMPQRIEDAAGRVARRNEDFPNPTNQPACGEDIICYFLPPEMRTTTSWQWFMPTVTGGNFTSAAAALRDKTLPASEEQNPYVNASIDTLRRIFPALDLPVETTLEFPHQNP